MKLESFSLSFSSASRRAVSSSPSIGIEPAEHHRLGVAVPRQGLGGGVHGIGDRLSRAGLAHVLDAGDEVPHLAGAELADRGGDGHAHADLLDFLGEARLHVPDLGGAAQDTVHDPDRAHHPSVLVVGRVEDQGAQRRAGVSRWSRHPLHDGVEELLDALPRLGRDPQDRLGRDAEDALDLGRVLLGLGRGKVDLVERGDDLEVVLQGLVTGGEGLGLNALGGVDEQHRPFTGRQGPAHLVAEVDVAGRVDQVQDVVLEPDPDVLGLDGDAPLALEVHGVEVLLAHEPGVDGVGELENAVRQRRLPVVDMADDGEIADEVRAEHGTRSVPAQALTPGPMRSLAPVLLGSRPWWCPVAPPVRPGFRAGQEHLSFHLDRQRAAHSGARLGAANNLMANIRSQIKRNRQNERRRLSNKSVRSEIRTRTKTAVTAVDAGADNAAEATRAAVRRIDKAAAQGVIHKNQAANRKSRLMRRANASSEA